MLKLGFIILILIFPLGVLSRIQLSDSIAISLNDIAIFLIVLFFAIRKIKEKKFFFFKYPLFKPIFIFMAIAVLSLLINIKNLSFLESITSSLYLLRWILYAGLYFLVIDFDTKFRQKVSIFLVISGAIAVIGGYFQYFLYPELRNLIYLGWDEHLYRMFSSFLDPNFAGAFFVLYFIFALSVFIEQSRYIKLLLGLILTLTLGAIFLTYSRSALIMLVVSFAVFLFLIKQKKLIFIFISLSLLITFLLPKSFKTEGTNFLRTASAKARIDSSENALSIIRDNIFFGVGFNAYRYAQYRYGFLNDKKEIENHSGAGTDNSYLFILATTGIVGFAAYLYLLRRLFKIKDKILIASMAGLLVNALFINSLFYTFIMEWIWILAGLTFKESK